MSTDIRACNFYTDPDLKYVSIEYVLKCKKYWYKSVFTLKFQSVCLILVSNKYFSLSLFQYSDQLRLSSPENYRYLNQSGCIWDETLDDKTSFDHVLVRIDKPLLPTYQSTQGPK